MRTQDVLPAGHIRDQADRRPRDPAPGRDGRRERPGGVPVSPPDGGANLAFYAGLGFVSGFSERFAQDVIAQASRDDKRAKPPPPPDPATT
jgi:hypothetical protein